MNIKKIKVGSRKSPLALAQVDEIKLLLKDHGIDTAFDVLTYETSGDQDKVTSLTDQNVADNFFTDTLDQAVLNKDIDAGIHSAKDLPRTLPAGLTIYALTEGQDSSDAFVGKLKFSDLPAGSSVGTSSTLRQKEIARLRPDLKIVDIRGTIKERIQLVEDGICDGVVIATIALKRLHLTEYISDIMPWEGFPLQGQLAVVGREDAYALKSLFKTIDVRQKYGTVTLVGAGPGDPDLITVKGVQALKNCDCVLHDYLIHKSLLDYAPRAEKIYVGKRKGEHSLKQSELNKLIREQAMAGKNTVRLKGGDPFIFGRGFEEVLELQAYHIPVEVVPGVSSATAIPALLGVPLTARDFSSSVAFVSAYAKEEDHQHPGPIDVPDADTIVFLMGLSKLNMIVESLLKIGKSEDLPVMVVSKGTRYDEHVVAGTCRDIVEKVRQEDVKPPALIVAGEVVRFYHKARGQKTILYTGTHPEKYQALGRIIHWPMITIQKAVLNADDQNMLTRQLASFDKILLTSRFAVKYFFEHLKELNINAGLLAEKDFIVIGKDTADALLEHDFKPGLQADVETSHGVFEAMREKYKLSGAKILFPRSSLSNPFLKEALINNGAEVRELTVYENIKPEKRPLPSDKIHKILFTSPSTVVNFLEDNGDIPKTWRILSKGPVTRDILKKAGYESEVLIYG